MYGLFDWQSVPVKLLATLTAGLPADSRSKRALSGMPLELKTMLLAAIADRLSILLWQNTKAAQKCKNKPTMLLDILTAPPKEKDKIQGFATAAEFEAARARLLEG